MRSVEATGKTLEEARASAAEQLGVDESSLQVEVLDEPRKLLGFLGSAECRIRATVEDSEATTEMASEDEDADEAIEEEDDDEAIETDQLETLDGESPLEYVGRRAVEFLNETLDLMDLDAQAELTSVGDEEVVVDIEGADAAEVIGRHGATLDALQLLTAVVANKGLEDGARVILDAGGYRQRRIEMLENLAHSHAEKAKESGKEVVVKDLKPYERRIVHLSLREDPDVDTYSEGEGDDRHLVISPKV